MSGGRSSRASKVCAPNKAMRHSTNCLKPPRGRCGSCDACTKPERWREKHFEPRSQKKALKPTASAAAAAGAADFKRGDWVRIDGRHLGHVVRVDGEGKRVKLIVESAGDFRRRTVDPRKKAVELLEADGTSSSGDAAGC